jgi:hypothetical protein
MIVMQRTQIALLRFPKRGILTGGTILTGGMVTGRRGGRRRNDVLDPICKSVLRLSLDCPASASPDSEFCNSTSVIPVCFTLNDKYN